MSPQLTLSAHSIALVGAGSVAGAFGTGLAERGITVDAVLSLHLSSARRLARRIHSPAAITDPALLPATVSLLLLAIPDNALTAAAAAIAERAPLLFRRLTALHTSGALDAGALDPLRNLGTSTGAIHPLQSFPRTFTPEQNAARLTGIPFAIDGSRKAQGLAREIAFLFNGVFFHIPAEKRALYHAAAVFSSNYLVASIAAAAEILKTSFRVSPRILEPIARASIDAALTASPESALTGPIERGDVRTVERHIAALAKYHPRLLPLYSSLGIEAVRMGTHKGTLDPAKADELRSLLTRASKRSKR